MSATTINSFPAFHSYRSSRAWFMAFIVLLHLGFFWVLSSGLGVTIIDVVLPPPKVEFIKDPEPVDRPLPKPREFEPTTKDLRVEHRIPELGPVDVGEDAIIIDPPPLPPGGEIGNGGDVIEPQPVIVEPRIGGRGLSEPVYPPSEIRGEHEGTVLLSVLVLPSGRVGDVRIDRSSGYPKLDESAKREARLWRLTPGTRNGQPVQMWKQIPISFKLTNRD
jgi:protein TonB